MKSQRLAGCGTALVTPFTKSGDIDERSLRAFVDWQIASGVHFLVPCGSTGEAATMTVAEHRRVVEITVEQTGGRVPVVAGAASNDTKKAIALSREMESAGATHLLHASPMYNKPPQRGIVAHFQAVAAATDLPVIAYNIPGRCVINIEPETMTELAQIPNVKAVKQSNADLDQARHIVELGLDLYAGDDNLVLPFVELGGLGGVCVHTHVVGPQVKEMVRRFRAGDVESARKLDEELAAAYELIGVVTGPIQIKAALNLLGHDVGGVRLPLVEASDDEVAQIRSCLERLRLLEPSRVA
jgi:4-hydroxy-tetrahydrodipicolinate synthase